MSRVMGKTPARFSRGVWWAGMESETRSSILARVARLDEEVARIIEMGNEQGHPGWLLESSRELLSEGSRVAGFRAYLDERMHRRGQLYSQFLEAAGE